MTGVQIQMTKGELRRRRRSRSHKDFFGLVCGMQKTGARMDGSIKGFFPINKPEKSVTTGRAGSSF